MSLEDDGDENSAKGLADGESDWPKKFMIGTEVGVRLKVSALWEGEGRGGGMWAQVVASRVERVYIRCCTCWQGQERSAVKFLRLVDVLCVGLGLLRQT